jgi:hypothetical protein
MLVIRQSCIGLCCFLQWHPSTYFCHDIEGLYQLGTQVSRCVQNHNLHELQPEIVSNKLFNSPHKLYLFLYYF